MQETLSANALDRAEMTIIDPADACFTLSILLEVSPGRAHSIAVFNAAATVTRVQSLKGFVSAVFMASTEDDFVFELVEWESATALGTARTDHRYFDHVQVLHSHAENRHLGMSSLVLTDEPFMLERGDRVAVSLTEVVDVSPEALAAALCAFPRTGTLRHITPAQNGAKVISIARGESVRCPTGVERWQHRFHVAEAVTALPSATGRPVRHRLLAAVVNAVEMPDAIHA